ncbi:nuclease-related domain-containing protein [Sporosarcina sp. NCCP-2716]|uniref:nuclease-related domain-containing protein n=1 Tax=Sporosarcina sp. NCCP-2716 TaxID=2943679 RepID=UPI00203DCF9A|nr:nuclease-related domain-containing protein [Sporosarcina sp. NCCP-2716]
MQLLDSRMAIPEAESRRFQNLKKGIEGEKRFDSLTETIQNGVLLLRDLCLEYQHSIFQIDTLMISEKKIYLFEVKNYEGEYVFENGEFRVLASGQEILNPLHQLNRSVTLLRSLLNSLGFQIPIQGYLAFVNDQFTLYQAPAEGLILLPSQLKRFMAHIDRTPSILDSRHGKIAERLRERHLPNPPNERLPKYEYIQLRKGILCRDCRSFMERKGAQLVTCATCETAESAEHSVLRSVGEFVRLFPDKRITTGLIQDWCRIIDSRKSIRRVLSRHYKASGGRRYRYYIVEKNR